MLGSNVVHKSSEPVEFLSLLDNAVMYARTSGVHEKAQRDEKRVETAIERDGTEIVVSVRDYGLGIPEGEQARVFERFFRAHNITSACAPGSASAYPGLGLSHYVAAGTVQAHVGRMWFDSNEGEGSTFYFTLPALSSFYLHIRPFENREATSIVKGKLVYMETGNKQVTVRGCMSTPVYSCEPNTPIADAYQLMVQHKIGRLPVVERDQDVERTVGIVTLSDIQGARPPSAIVGTIYELNYYLAHLGVSQVMTHDPYTVRPDTPMEDAARLMLEQEIGGLPVVDEVGRLTGIVSHSDLLRMFVKYWLGPASNDETSAERAEHSGQEKGEGRRGSRVYPDRGNGAIGPPMPNYRIER